MMRLVDEFIWVILDCFNFSIGNQHGAKGKWQAAAHSAAYLQPMRITWLVFSMSAQCNSPVHPGTP